MQTLPTPLLALGAFLLAWLALRLYLRRWRPMRLITVIDGDTFMAVDMAGKRRKLRLLGVDCPELNQRNGPEARSFVQQAAAKEVVQVRLKGRDRYKRDLADVQVGGKSLALMLVRAGLAYPLGGSLSLRMASTGAWLSRRGVHKGFGQKKPWQSNSRGTGLVRWLSYRLKRKNPRR